MDKEKFKYLSNIRKTLYKQKKDINDLKNEYIELYNFNTIKKDIASNNLTSRLENCFCEFYYIILLCCFEYYNWTYVELVIPTAYTIIEALAMKINNNLKDMAYNEDDLLSKSLLNRSTISLLKKYLKLSKQNKSIGERIKTFNKGIEMTEELYQMTTNDIIDTMCDIDKELFDYERFILDCYKDEAKDETATKTEDSVKTYGGVKQSTIDVLNKYGLL